MFKPEKQVPIGLLVGLGAAASAAAAAAFYLLNRKDDEDFDLAPRGERDSGFSHFVTNSQTIYKQIPEEAMGTVIGKGGETIRLLQRKTNTSMNCSDEVDEEDNRIMRIKGSTTATLRAVDLIDELIDQVQAVKIERIFIEPSEIGLIIGKNGATVKSIAKESKTKIFVPKTSKTSKNLVRVEIKGEPDCIQSAINAINHKLSLHRSLRPSTKPASPIEVVKRQPDINFVPTQVNISNLPVERFEHLSAEDGEDVYVSSVHSPSRFWVQLCGTMSGDLDRLMVDMTDFYEKPENQVISRLSEFKVGDIIAAPLTGDEHWFRAVITQYQLPDESSGHTEDGNVTVHYLDFGDESNVLEKQCCLLHEEFLNRMTFQAIECSLFGVQPIEEEWDEETIAYFKKASRTSLWEKVLARTQKIVNLNGESRQHYLIDLLTLASSSDTNIAQSLIDKGYAVPSPKI